MKLFPLFASAVPQIGTILGLGKYDEHPTKGKTMIVRTAESRPYIIPADAVRALGRFSPTGPTGFQAQISAGSPVRGTRAEAMADAANYYEQTGGDAS